MNILSMTESLRGERCQSTVRLVTQHKKMKIVILLLSVETILPRVICYITYSMTNYVTEFDINGCLSVRGMWTLDSGSNVPYGSSPTGQSTFIDVFLLGLGTLTHYLNINTLKKLTPTIILTRINTLFFKIRLF